MEFLGCCGLGFGVSGFRASGFGDLRVQRFGKLVSKKRCRQFNNGSILSGVC